MEIPVDLPLLCLVFGLSSVADVGAVGSADFIFWFLAMLAICDPMLF
jgi:hypothetical protein